jgi:predicted RNase H-like nuclease (RuvC/YqgF family)
MKTTVTNIDSRIAYLKCAIQETLEKIEELVEENDDLTEWIDDEFDSDHICYKVNENERRIEEFEEKVAEMRDELLNLECCQDDEE